MRYPWPVVAVVLVLTAAILKDTPARADERSDIASAWAAYQRGDHATALKTLKPLAEAGNADAEYDLGTMYSDGHGVPRDPRLAQTWWEKAANQGQADAQFSLGFMLLHGSGEGDNAVAADPSAGLPWIEKAAAQGHASAEYFLGYLYWSGTSVPFDPQKALQYTLQAAEQGRADAEYQAGMILASQRGVQNAIEGYKWLELAARQNYPGAAQSRDRLAADRLAPAEVQHAKALADSFKPAAPMSSPGHG